MRQGGLRFQGNAFFQVRACGLKPLLFEFRHSADEVGGSKSIRIFDEIFTNLGDVLVSIQQKVGDRDPVRDDHRSWIRVL
jgi:hypothetical protein